MTASTTAAPADSSTGEGGTAGQAPASTTNPAGPGSSTGTGTTDTGTGSGAPSGAGDGGQGDGPRGRRAPGEHVRSASRGDLEPREPEQAGTGRSGTGRGDTGGKQGRGDDQGRTGRDAGTDAGDSDAGDGEQGRKAGDWRIEDLPPGAQKLIGDLRKENGTRRTEAADAKKAAQAAEKKATDGDERFAKATQAFMTALGLTPEPDEPQRSPEELLAEATTNYRNTRVELAVFRAAAAHGADPEALLDSRAFLTKAHALDPSGEDFNTAIAAAISDAVDGNPKLRAEAPARPAQQAPSGGDFGGGPAGPPGPEEWSVDDFRRARRNERG